MPPFTLADHIIFGLLAFVLPLFAMFHVRPGVLQIPDDTRIKIRLYWANSIVLWIGALIIIALWLGTGRSFVDLGFRMPEQTGFPEWMILCAVFALLYMFDTFVSWVEASESPAAAILPSNWREFRHFASVVSLSAGVCEEIVFRGFVITYLLAFLEGADYRVEFSIVAAAIIFGLVHAYQGGRALLKVMILAVIFGWIFVLSESLVLVIVLHVFVDVLGGLLSVLKNKEDRRLKSQPEH